MRFMIIVKATKESEAEVVPNRMRNFSSPWPSTTVLSEMLQNKNPKKSGSVMQALLKMKKLDIQTLQHAYDQA